MSSPKNWIPSAD